VTGKNDIAALVEQAKSEAEAKKDSAGKAGKARIRSRRRSPFKVEHGQIWREVEDEATGNEGKKRWVPFGSELNVLALTRTTDGQDWGSFLEIVDRDGNRHKWAMPFSLLAGRGDALLGELFRLGFELYPTRGAQRWLVDYINGYDPQIRARCVTSIGWHDKSFVLPNETISVEAESETVILQSAAPLDHAFNCAGTLAEWQDNVGRLCLGNSRLILSVAAAFASPLLAVTGEDGGGFHLRGESSKGKSTALYVGGSVWGGGATGGYVKSWRATDNALESTCTMHNGALLCLDELAQIDPKSAPSAAYMIANGVGKSRSGKEGQSRKVQKWALIYLSTGEIGLADKIVEGGGRIAAGMQVRVIDLRADAGAGMGLFEDLHGAEDAATFSKTLRIAAGRYYGTPSRSFLRELVRDLDQLKIDLEALRRDFIAEVVPHSADGQVRRVADRFALVAAAGEIAGALEITGWPPGAVSAAAKRCFHNWLSERGGHGSSEVADARRRLLDAIDTYGAARFQKWQIDSTRAVINPRWGFIKSSYVSEDDLGQPEYYLTVSGMKEIMIGLDRKSVVASLLDKGIVRQKGDSEVNKVFNVPSANNTRLYQLDLEALRGYDGTE
jgi:putative DNA primase/helicase